MTEKEKLLNTLFATQGLEHANIKFFRASSDLAAVTVEEFCAAVNRALAQAKKGLDRYPETLKPVEVKEIVAKAAAN